MDTSLGLQAKSATSSIVWNADESARAAGRFPVSDGDDRRRYALEAAQPRPRYPQRRDTAAARTGGWSRSVGSLSHFERRAPGMIWVGTNNGLIK